MPEPLPYARNLGTTVPTGMEPLARYRERRIDIVQEFVLLPDRVVICGSRPFFGEWETTVELATLSPNSGYMRVRPKFFQHGLVMLACGIGFGLLSVADRGQAILWPERFAIGLAALGAAMTLLALHPSGTPSFDLLTAMLSYSTWPTPGPIVPNFAPL